MLKKLFGLFSGDSENLKKIEELTSKVSSLENSLIEAENETKSYKEKLSIEENKLRATEDKLQQISSSNNDSVSVEASLNAELNTLKKKLESSESELNTLRNENSTLKNELAKINAKMTEMASSSASTNIKVNQELETIKTELETYKEKFGAIKEDTKVRDKRRALVIDDSVILRNLQKGILESAGFEVILAKNGVEGKKNIEKHNPDIIVTDIEMPEMDGINLTKWIKDTPEYKKTPVIMITSHSSDEDKKRCMESGADAFIIKDQFNQKSFLELISKFLGS